MVNRAHEKLGTEGSVAEQFNLQSPDEHEEHGKHRTEGVATWQMCVNSKGRAAKGHSRSRHTYQNVEVEPERMASPDFRSSGTGCL